MIIQTVDEQRFVNEFADMGRADNFSVEARKALFEYHNDLSDDTGQPFELDIIAICCDWSEYDLQDALNDYSHLLDSDSITECDGDEEALLDYIEEVLNEETFVIRLDNTLLIQAF